MYCTVTVLLPYCTVLLPYCTVTVLLLYCTVLLLYCYRAVTILLPYSYCTVTVYPDLPAGAVHPCRQDASLPPPGSRTTASGQEGSARILQPKYNYVIYATVEFEHRNILVGTIVLTLNFINIT